MTGAHRVHGWKWKTHRTGGLDEVAGFGNMNINYSQPNELTQDVEIGAPRAVRVVRRVRIGLYLLPQWHRHCRRIPAWRSLKNPHFK